MKLVKSLFICVAFIFCSQNSNAFQLYCPGDVWLTCNDEIWDLSGYGNAYYVAYGVTYDAGYPTVSYNLNSCNTGTIYRTWTVEDPYWNPVSCTQVIHVSGGSFTSSNIYWPHQELHLYGCNTSLDPYDLPYGYNRPHYDYLTCSHIGISYDDQVFNFGPDCKKIIRKWTLIDWCQYIPGSNYHGIWKYSQLIKLSNTETPILTCAKDVVVDALECDGAYVNTPLVSIEGESCTGDYNVSNNSYYADYHGADASGRYPIGKTTVEYTIEYACGREMVCRTNIQVKDNKPAVPYCYSGLNVSLMPLDTDNDGMVDDGMVEVWAKDLDVGSYHPCNNGPLTFSFSSDVTETFRIFTCEEVGVNAVQMWVTDVKGNQSYCVVNLTVQNNAANIPDCEPDEAKNFVLSGHIMDQHEDRIDQVQVTLKDRVPAYKLETVLDSSYDYEIIDSFYNATNVLVHIYNLTVVYHERIIDSTVYYNVFHLESNENGVYGTNNILANRDYEITAYRRGDMTKVTEEDLIRLRKHVEGEEIFTNPYSYLAGDINEDGKVDISDVWLLEELVSGEEDEWPNERQWVFYNMNEMAEMTDRPNEDDLSQDIKVQNVQGKTHDLDFMGILKGDIDKLELISDSIKISMDQRSSSIEDLSIYPNPFSEEITIEFIAGQSGSLSVFSAQGKEMYKIELNERDNRIKIAEASSWVQGTYIYRIERDSGSISGKLIKL